MYGLIGVALFAVIVGVPALIQAWANRPAKTEEV